MLYYIAAGVFAIFSIAVIIFVIRVYKENKNLDLQKGQRIDDDEDEIRFPS
jgi:hypothetical protein